MADHREKIPGWLDAITVERYEHDASFTHPFDLIAGIRVRHMTLLDAMRLEAMGCPFLGGMPDEAMFITSTDWHDAAVQMVTFLRTDFRIATGTLGRWRTARQQRQIRKVSVARLYDEIKGYQERTFMDRLGGGGKPDPISRWSSAVDYVDILATEYGWPARDIINMPFRQLMQYVRRIVRRKDDKAHIPSLADSAVAAYLEKINSKRSTR